MWIITQDKEKVLKLDQIMLIEFKNKRCVKLGNLRDININNDKTTRIYLKDIVATFEGNEIVLGTYSIEQTLQFKSQDKYEMINEKNNVKKVMETLQKLITNANETQRTAIKDSDGKIWYSKAKNTYQMPKDDEVC